MNLSTFVANQALIDVSYDASKANPFGIDASIESMNSQQFSVGIFYFLIAAIFIFVGIIVMYMFMGKNKHLKKGEKWLFAWLIFGVVVAIAFGAAQMLHGYLF